MGQTEIVKSEDRQGQQKETKGKHRTHSSTLKQKLELNEPYKNQCKYQYQTLRVVTDKVCKDIFNFKSMKEKKLLHE